MKVLKGGLNVVFLGFLQEKTNPVKREKLSETSPAFKILSTEPRSELEPHFKHNRGAVFGTESTLSQSLDSIRTEG